MKTSTMHFGHFLGVGGSLITLYYSVTCPCINYLGCHKEVYSIGLLMSLLALVGGFVQ